MKISRRIAIARKRVRELAALVEARVVAAADTPRAAPSFRPLNADEAEALLGTGLLASLAAVLRS